MHTILDRRGAVLVVVVGRVIWVREYPPSLHHSQREKAQANDDKQTRDKATHIHYP